MHRGEELENMNVRYAYFRTCTEGKNLKKKKKTALKTEQIFITFLSSFFKKKLRSLLKSITFIYVCMCVGWGGRYAVADIWRS